MILKLVERYPAIMYIGAGVLAFTAGKMVVNEKLLAPWFKGPELPQTLAYWGFVSATIVVVLALGWMHNRRVAQRTGAPERPEQPAA
jgi:predicted tellurium resistance membrane protein TerC